MQAHTFSFEYVSTIICCVKVQVSETVTEIKRSPRRAHIPLLIIGWYSNNHSPNWFLLCSTYTTLKETCYTSCRRNHDRTRITMMKDVYPCMCMRQPPIIQDKSKYFCVGQVQRLLGCANLGSWGGEPHLLATVVEGETYHDMETSDRSKGR